ncbi:hypothetical protein Z969_03855 [Clostridium novyi A str. 4570]|uniref:Uncharacterized protein n=1 Tax=Clostridium novyi A str. 4570 TaxID=1444290 RepID=A0AA88ZTZ0_CLONO|nr:hypothetical protein [Clostridium novyi]KGN02634.1 hypothetical protein Z969_03855 [Clostridium novyi A str. 4570]
MSDIVSNIIPIVLLICFGHFIRYKDMLTEDVIKGIRKIVIDISLPAILFITFVNMEIRKEYFVIMIATVFLLVAFYFFVAIRLTVILVVGYLFKFFVIDKIITPDKLFNYAYFTFFDFAYSVFTSNLCIAVWNKRRYGTVNNEVVLSTVVCIVVFIGFVMMI